MRERFFITLSLVLIVAALIGLNAASYAPTEREPDDEARPNRSTLNAGASGTRAFYEFLRETGKPVTRWQEKPAALLREIGTQPKTFVVFGEMRRQFEKQEITDVLNWTARGNRLVVVTRQPLAGLLPRSGNWQPEIIEQSSNVVFGDSSNVNEMTKDVSAATPAQPTLLTRSVNSVLPSKFAAAVNFTQTVETSEDAAFKISPANAPDAAADEEIYDEDRDDAPVIAAAPAPIQPEQFSMFAPVVHLSGKDRAILADYGYGAGRIIVLTDPYIVSNGGIEQVDNLRLATNIVTSGNGLIAFDEYHQGYGAAGNSLLNFFAGTPLPAIAAQFALLAIFIVYTRGRRFARALPLPNPDRRSKLEYVQAMAELQRRTQAYDLAVENIYGRVRRELARFAGVDNLSTKSEVLAARVAERSKLKAADLTGLFLDCEDVIQGEKINGKTALSLIARLREVEHALGFARKTTKVSE